MARKTYNEKLMTTGDLPYVQVLTDPKEIERYGGRKMLIAPPLAYDELMKKVPFGKVITSQTLRDCLAKRYGADFTCPLTAGIFINIAAHASMERADHDTPWWRTLKKDGELNEKYPEGIDGQKLRLQMEGHTVVQKGKRYFVSDYAEKLFALS